MGGQQHVWLTRRSQAPRATGSEGGPPQGEPSSRQGGPAPSQETVSTQLARLSAEIVASPLFYVAAGLVAIKLVASTGEQSVSILVFAALPITALTALSKSSLGKQVGERSFSVEHSEEGQFPTRHAYVGAQHRAGGRQP